MSYVDYLKTELPEGNGLTPFVYKRASLSHEQEYRLVVQTEKSEVTAPPEFMRLPVDNELLVQSVFVSPDAPDWAAQVVERAVRTYLPGVLVQHSDLLQDPIQ